MAIGLGLSTLILLVVFNRFPGIDLAVAEWFFTEWPCPEDHPRPICGGFMAMNDPATDADKGGAALPPRQQSPSRS